MKHSISPLNRCFECSAPPLRCPMPPSVPSPGAAPQRGLSPCGCDSVSLTYSTHFEVTFGRCPRSAGSLSTKQMLMGAAWWWWCPVLLMTHKSGLEAIIALVIVAPPSGQNTSADLCNDTALNVKTLPDWSIIRRDIVWLFCPGFSGTFFFGQAVCYYKTIGEHKSSFLPPLLRFLPSLPLASTEAGPLRMPGRRH